MIAQTLETYFPFLLKNPELKSELETICTLHKFAAGTQILKQGGYIKVIPLMISGLAKVFKQEEKNGNEVLLYYIKPGETCVMSMITLMRNEISTVKAVIEKDSEIVVIPANKAIVIAKKYPVWNDFIYQLFYQKYEELVEVVEILTFSNKDKRLLQYLKKEARLKGSTKLKTTHQHIAYDLGSSREVISRLLKKLEHQGVVKLKQGVIQILE